MTSQSEADAKVRRKDLGDFQTPAGLVSAVLDRIGPIGDRFARVLEPTCGRGSFLSGLLDRPDPPREIRGFEIQSGYVEASQAVAARAPAGVRVVVEQADLFRLDLGSIDWQASGRLLVVGNLPWVTNAALGMSGGPNGVSKHNHRGLRGIDAVTGESNFDISEALWLKLIRELAPQRPTIALVGKTAVARALFRAIDSAGLPIVSATLRRVDAPRWFGASVDAGLLEVEVGPGERAREMPVYDDLSAESPRTTVGRSGDRLIADLAAYRRVSHVDGTCPLEWRQGVKHDAAPVMELTSVDEIVRNKLGEVVQVESDYLYPLRKGSDLIDDAQDRPKRLVVVTQRRLNDPVDRLEGAAPRLWSYLERHGEVFDRRRSSIYRGRARFSMFGVGDYSFAPYKVAISGLHKTPRFRLLAPVDGRPVLLDDTCYFLPFASLDDAARAADALNGSESLDLIRALSFRDAKRPITKALLRRIDLAALRPDAVPLSNPVS